MLFMSVSSHVLGNYEGELFHIFRFEWIGSRLDLKYSISILRLLSLDTDEPGGPRTTWL
jgi:hypothetical protein